MPALRGLCLVENCQPQIHVMLSVASVHHSTYLQYPLYLFDPIDPQPIDPQPIDPRWIQSTHNPSTLDDYPIENKCTNHQISRNFRPIITVILHSCSLPGSIGLSKLTK